MNIFDENSQDQHLRQKLDNIEFELPTNAWADMQARLDEAAITQSDEALRQQVAAQNLPPPAYAWDELRQQLDQIQQPNTESQLRQQVAAHQWTLPAFAWEQLDNQLETQSLQEKVAEHQHQLPANAWAKMEQQLDIDARRRRRKAIFWWSAAAASLLLLTTATVYNYQPTAKPVNTTATQIASNQTQNNQNINNLSPLIINSVTKSLQLFNNSTYTNQSNVANTQIISPSAPVAQQNNNSKQPKANTNLANTNLANNANNANANNNKANIENANIVAQICPPIINVATISPQLLSNNQFIEEPIFLEKGRPSPWQANIWAGVATKIVEGSNKIALSPVIGIGATYQIDAHNKFVLGIQYKSINPQGSFPKGIAHTLIDYNPAQEANHNNSMNLMTDASDEPTADIYQLNKINMIEVPIAYHYQVNKKHAFQVGTKVGFIANINTTRQKPQQTPALKLNRYDVGIAVVNMAATLAYEYRFNRSFALNVQYAAGFSNLMSSAQKKYRAYGSFWGQDAAAGQVYMLLADNKPTPPVLIQTPEKMFNNDLQLSLRFNF